MQEQEYNDLKAQLNKEQKLYLQYATGAAFKKLENVQKANMHRNNCKIIEQKIRLIENGSI